MFSFAKNFSEKIAKLLEESKNNYYFFSFELLKSTGKIYYKI